jgi:hypothetical protein
MRRFPSFQNPAANGTGTRNRIQRQELDMPRKSAKTDRWTPSPEWQDAYERVIRTAHLSAAALWGEKPVDNPSEDASCRALMQAMGMMYFLLRIDPRDARLLFTGEGSPGNADYKPFPPGYVFRKGVFAELLR